MNIQIHKIFLIKNLKNLHFKVIKNERNRKKVGHFSLGLKILIMIEDIKYLQENNNKLKKISQAKKQGFR